MDQTLFAFVGALNIDSSLNINTYKSFVALLPFIFANTEFCPFFKQECLKILEENKTDIIRFPEIFRVSKEAFKQKTISINDTIYYPGKLFSVLEFDIDNKESSKKLVEYITELEIKGKKKLVNIIMGDDNFINPNHYIENSYYILHSHVISVCLKKEREMGKTGLIKDFVLKMKNSAK